ncbi:hypothetical protein ROU88_02215 [Macrococcus capreoli]|uniref:hypothetical protein n=1 Tax=Macrococcus capreoli TaxID=2982690 RepID=UPI0021D5922D|nr:hypothetical protein [Macrococcus sp. TMW 2.2395]MCU7556392.1 hypothetical protein [Macrococcus sp. TMW 2.2395]
MMEFLYFPENKWEYVPAVMSLIFFMTLAYLSFKMFIRNSKQQEEKFKVFEAEVMKKLEDERHESRL